MLADDLMGFCDAREIRRSIPREQMRKVNQELSGLLVGETDAQSLGGCDKELPKGTLMFHVEHLREMIQEVKGFLSGKRIRRLSFLFFKRDEQHGDGCGSYTGDS